MAFTMRKGDDWTGPALAIFSLAAGVSVGNLYLAQPILADIAASLGVSTQTCGLLVTMTQIGYAVGILAIVPLGDLLNRRILIPLSMAASAIALACCAAAPGMAILSAGVSALGLSTVSGQLVIPMVRDGSSASRRGFAVGLVSAGTTLGIMVARVASGLIANALGWRMVYVVGTILNLAAAILLLATIPAEHRSASHGAYASPRAIVVLLHANRNVLRLMATAGLVFGICFNMFWNGLTFLLSAAPFSMDPSQIGLVSLAGVAGAVGSLGIGKLLDAGHGHATMLTALALTAASLALAATGRAGILTVVIAAALFSLGVQGVNVLAQTQAISAVPGRSSLLNMLFVVNNFVMGAVGSTLASMLWRWGWTTVMAVAIACAAAAFLLNLRVRRPR